MSSPPAVDLATTLVLTPRRWPILLFAVFALLLGLLGLFLFASGIALGAGATAAGVGFLMTVFFGGGGVLVLRGASARKNALVLDRDGFTIRRLMEQRRYAWSDIAAFEVASRNGQNQIVFKLSDTAAPPALQQWMRRNTDIGRMLPHGGHADWLTSTYGLEAQALRDLLAAWRAAALAASPGAASQTPR
ncbi:MAG: hypothetical protein KIT16_16490 [Rhodospirillaceae bacterium]|nr:hypothetical protein [Rhodospirillaceae bacterium]